MRKIKLLHFFLFSCFRYYYDNRDVKEDKEFGNFLNELSIDGKPLFHGRIGKVSLLSTFFTSCFIADIALTKCY